MVQESDINFRVLAYEIDAGMYVCDPQGTFIYANLALAGIFGFERPIELFKKNFRDFIPPEKHQLFMNRFRESLVSGTNATVIPTDILRRDGKTRHIEVSSMPFIKDNALLGSQGVVRDITQYWRTENELMHTGTHDPLTGIYNRTFFDAEIKRLERGRQYPISIIVVYAGIHESVDYESRDKRLKRVAHQLFYAFRGDDIVARIGEEAFAVLLPGVDEATVEEILKRVRGKLLELNNEGSAPLLEFHMGLSTARDGEQLTAVLRQAKTVAALEKKRKKK